MNNRTIIPIVLVPIEIVCISHSLMILWHDSISVYVDLSCCQVSTWTGFSFDAVSCYNDPNGIQYTSIFIRYVARGKSIGT